MKDRLDKLKRINRLQRRLHDLAVWRLAALGHRRDELTGAHVEMLDAVGTGLMAYGAPAAAALRRIRALEVEIVAAKSGFDEQAKRSLEQGVRSKLADRARGVASAAYRAELEKRSLADLIDMSVAGGLPGPRKP